MKKHLHIKAFLMLVVILFHSFVLVPVANATAFEQTLARIVFRAYSPATVAALSAGTSMVLGLAIGAGVGYVIYKSGAVAAIKSWFDTNLLYPPPTGANATEYFTLTNGSGRLELNASFGSGKWWGGGQVYFGSSGEHYWPGYSCSAAGDSGHASAQEAKAHAAILVKNRAAELSIFENAGHGSWSHWNTAGGGSYPTVEGDYGTQLDEYGPPVLPAGSVYASPGAMAALSGGAAIVSRQTMSDADADRFIVGSGATQVNSAANTQDGTAPNVDNTLTADTNAAIPLWQQMVNYLSNLIGIKTSVDAQRAALDNVVANTSTLRTAMDNVAAISSSQAGKLDNIATIAGQQKAVLDNVGIGIANQTAILEGVGEKIEHMDNTLSGINTTTATAQTVQSRIDALKTAASTKFPFSLASSLSVSAINGTSTYEFTALPLTPSISIPIQPMLGPLHSLFDWIRQLLVWFFWVGTLYAILRKGMAM